MDFGTKPLSKSEQVSLGNIAAAAVGAARARQRGAAGTMAGESWPLQIVEHVRERSALVCHTQCRAAPRIPQEGCKKFPWGQIMHLLPKISRKCSSLSSNFTYFKSSAL